MTRLRALIAMAKLRFPNHEILPVGKKNSLSDCMTVENFDDGEYDILWYNIGTFTHIEKLVREWHK